MDWYIFFIYFEHDHSTRKKGTRWLRLTSSAPFCCTSYWLLRSWYCRHGKISTGTIPLFLRKNGYDKELYGICRSHPLALILLGSGLVAFVAVALVLGEVLPVSWSKTIWKTWLRASNKRKALLPGRPAGWIESFALDVQRTYFHEEDRLPPFRTQICNS